MDTNTNYLIAALLIALLFTDLRFEDILAPLTQGEYGLPILVTVLLLGYIFSNYGV